LFGRTILELFNGTQIQGDQQLQWNGQDQNGNEVPPGLYMIRLSGKSVSSTARAIKTN
jgi:flagellar hook assembly protein FlgD